MTKKINMQITTIEGFSGHSDRKQLLNYINSLNPTPKKILVDHGEKDKTISFSKFLANKFRISVSAPKVLECVRLR